MRKTGLSQPKCAQNPFTALSPPELQNPSFVSSCVEYWFIYTAIKVNSGRASPGTADTRTSGQTRGENEQKRGWIKHVSEDVESFQCFLCRAGGEPWASLMVNPLCNERTDAFSLTGKYTRRQRRLPHTRRHTNTSRSCTQIFSVYSACTTWHSCLPLMCKLILEKYFSSCINWYMTTW